MLNLFIFNILLSPFSVLGTVAVFAGMIPVFVVKSIFGSVVNV